MEDPNQKERTDFFKPLLEKAIMCANTSSTTITAGFEEPIAKRTRQQYKHQYRHPENILRIPSRKWNPISQIFNLGRKIGESFTNIRTYPPGSVRTHFVDTKLSKYRRNGKRKNRRKSGNVDSLEKLNFSDVYQIKSLFKRAMAYTTQNLQLTQLELFYDVLNNIVSRATSSEILIQEINDVIIGFENMTHRD